MNNIGELFKVLGKNEIFANYVKEVASKSNEEIINFAINDNELMDSLSTIVNDIEIIKVKMDVIIGQKRKSYEKQLEKDNITNVKSDCEDNVIVYKYEPLNVNNVVYSDEHFYLEKNGLRLRLVTSEFEMYY